MTANSVVITLGTLWVGDDRHAEREDYILAWRPRWARFPWVPTSSRNRARLRDYPVIRRVRVDGGRAKNEARAAVSSLQKAAREPSLVRDVERFLPRAIVVGQRTPQARPETGKAKTPPTGTATIVGRVAGASNNAASAGTADPSFKVRRYRGMSGQAWRPQWARFAWAPTTSSNRARLRDYPDIRRVRHGGWGPARKVWLPPTILGTRDSGVASPFSGC